MIRHLHDLAALERHVSSAPRFAELVLAAAAGDDGSGCRTAGQICAPIAAPFRRLPRVGDKWHLDEVVLKIAGVKHWLWRAVDQTGIVLDVLVQRRRDKQSAKRLLRKLLKKQMRLPRVVITDKLASYGAAKREVMPSIEHRQHKGLNNRAENSHQPTRRRERQMKQFKSAGQAIRRAPARCRDLCNPATRPSRRC